MNKRYDVIGSTYARTRREDPRIAATLAAALGDARTVVNVGAGTGSYEPTDRHVIAIEPSEVMIRQRPERRVPAILASADAVPLLDASVDASMAILTVHHWDGQREQGIRELRRVARDVVLILTIDPRISSRMWLMADYLPELAALDSSIFPAPEEIATWLGGSVRIETVLIARDTPDWTLLSFWAHPERVFDAEARSGTSGFARIAPAATARAVSALERDLANGAWEARHGHLRALDEYDAGLRMIVALP